jgi:hypothetical protein
MGQFKVYRFVKVSIGSTCLSKYTPGVRGVQLIGQRLMWAFVVVEANVLGQIVVSLLWACVLVEIDFLVLDGTPQPLGEDIVSGASPAIHADLNLGGQQTVEILGAGEVAALITVPDVRCGLQQG